MHSIDVKTEFNNMNIAQNLFTIDHEMFKTYEKDTSWNNYFKYILGQICSSLVDKSCADGLTHTAQQRLNS